MPAEGRVGPTIAHEFARKAPRPSIADPATRLGPLSPSVEQGIGTAQRAQRLAFLGRQRRQWEVGCTPRAVEEGVRPCLPTQAPSKDHADRSRHEPGIEPRRSLRWVTDRILAEDAPNRATE